MRAELTAFLAEFADARQREHLKAPRIGKNGTVPRVELMQATSLAQDIESWAQVQMIGVAQNNLGLYLLAQLGEMYTLDASHRTYWHEDGRLDLAVICCNKTRASIRGIVAMLYFKRHFFSSFSSGMSNFSGLSTIWSVRAKFHTSCTFST